MVKGTIHYLFYFYYLRYYTKQYPGQITMEDPTRSCIAKFKLEAV